MFRTCVLDRLHTTVRDVDPRGGSSIVEVNSNIVVFGGANREQGHFQDLVVYKSSSSNSSSGHSSAFNSSLGVTSSNNSTSSALSSATGGPHAPDSAAMFRSVKATGDIPMPRSGHAVAGFGKFMFLFGGVDFAEEAAFNDLYMLDTETFVWSYVGESGAEIRARNSHSLAVMSVATGGGIEEAASTGALEHFLVLFGGASPEHGPLGDTFYAKLPADPNTIDPASFFVTWRNMDERDPLFASLPNPDLPAPPQGDPQAEPPSVFRCAQGDSARNHADDSGPSPVGDASLSRAIGVASHQQYPCRPCPREMHGTCCARFSLTWPVGAGRNTGGGVGLGGGDGSETGHPECVSDSLFVLGGRAASGEVLSDIWELSFCSSSSRRSSSSSSSSSIGNKDFVGAQAQQGGELGGGLGRVLVWRPRPDLQLPAPRCALGCAAVVAHEETDKEGAEELGGGMGIEAMSNDNHAAVTWRICSFGGFSGASITNDAWVSSSPLLLPSQHPCSDPGSDTADNIGAAQSTGCAPAGWQVLSLSGNRPYPPRFGLALCAASGAVLRDMGAVLNARYAPVLSARFKAALQDATASIGNNSTSGSGGSSGEDATAVDGSAHALPRGMVLFGGVDAETDFGDVWAALPCP